MIIVAFAANDRLREGEIKDMFNVVQQMYGQECDLWSQRTIIVFTKCNKAELFDYPSKWKQVLGKKFKQDTKELKKKKIEFPTKLEKILVTKNNVMSNKQFDSIPIVWAYGKDEDNWKYELYEQAHSRMKETHSQRAFQMLNPYVTSENIKNPELLAIMDSRILGSSPAFGAAVGAAIGATVAGPIGAGIGGAIGALWSYMS